MYKTLLNNKHNLNNDKIELYEFKNMKTQIIFRNKTNYFSKILNNYHLILMYDRDV